MEKASTQTAAMALGDIGKGLNSHSFKYIEKYRIFHLVFNDMIEKIDFAKPKNKQINIVSIPIKIRHSIENYFLYDRSLPYGISANNSPVYIICNLPKEIFIDTQKIAIILSPEDWVAVSLLPQILGFCNEQHLDIEIHIICKSLIGSKVPTSERYIYRSKKYGGLKEIALISAGLENSKEILWYIWDLSPSIKRAEKPIQTCLKYLVMRCVLEKKHGKLHLPGLLKPSNNELLPYIFRAVGIGIIASKREELKAIIHSIFSKNLFSYLNIIHPDFPTAMSIGWSKTEWLRRPAFYNSLIDLERYLVNKVWRGDGINGLWEKAFISIGKTAIDRVYGSLSKIADMPDSNLPNWKFDKKSYELWHKELLEKTISEKDKTLKEIENIRAFINNSLLNSQITKFGYGWHRLTTLQSFFSNKRDEINERLKLCNNYEKTLKIKLQNFTKYLTHNFKIPTSIEKVNSKKQQLIFHEFFNERIIKLASLKSEIRDTIREIIWKEILVSAKAIIDKLVFKIPQFIESTKIINNQSYATEPNDSANNELVGLFALYHTTGHLFWHKYFEEIWFDFFDTEKNQDPTKFIQKGLERLTKFSTKRLHDFETTSEAIIAKGLSVEETSSFIKKRNRLSFIKTDNQYNEIEDLNNYLQKQKAIQTALYLTNQGSIHCRFHGNEPKFERYLLGDLSKIEKTQILKQTDFTLYNEKNFFEDIRAFTISITEPFSINKIRTYENSYKDWRIWAAEKRKKSKFMKGEFRPFKIIGSNDKEYYQLSLHILKRIAILLDLYRNKQIDWDKTGKVIMSDKHYKTLHDWMENNWETTNSENTTMITSSEDNFLSSTSIDQKTLFDRKYLNSIPKSKLAAIPGISGTPPLIASFLSNLRHDPVTGFLNLQSELYPVKKPKELWTFKRKA